MKYLKFLRTYVCLLLGFAAFTACTSDEEEALIPEGKGYVKLSLNADAGFRLRRWMKKPIRIWIIIRFRF